MSTFLSSQGQFTQEHFSVVEITTPVVVGACTINGLPGYGTPLSCDESSTGDQVYKFTDINAPLLDESGILRLVKRISENTAKLLTGKGLASRGTATITLIDVKGIDPNPYAPAVTADVIKQGSYLTKLVARNQLINRDIVIKNYRVESDGTIDLANGAEERHYIIKSVSQTSKGEFRINCEDELSRINVGETVWPLPLEGYIRTDVNSSATTINVDPNVTYLVGDTVRSGEELMKITGVSNIGTGSAQITVQTRGSDIVYTNTLSKTISEEHSAGDELFVCDVSDDEGIDDLLERICLDIGIDAAYIPKADWTAEIDEWHPTTTVNTIWIESLSTSKMLEMILSNYLLNMWFDPTDREIKISAITVWKESSLSLKEGEQIDFETITTSNVEGLRATRAYITYNKRYLASADSIENYKKASLFKRTDLETDDYFGEDKVKKFEPSSFLDGDSADLLVNRWVNRYVDPKIYAWTTQEKKRTFNVGDIVDIESSVNIGFNGLPNASTRAQVVQINPKYTNVGREYKVLAESYEPAFSSGTEVPLTGVYANQINIYNQIAGRPSGVVTFTVVFDAATVLGNDSTTPSIIAGGFAAGSKIIIILANGSDLGAKGGNGGDGGGAFYEATVPKWFLIPNPKNGKDGGIVYDAQNIDTDIYFSGATPSTNYPIADGYIKAPSGGDGGFNANVAIPIGGAGGNGGAGAAPGNGGTGGIAEDGLGVQHIGADGGLNVSQSVDGQNNDALGGLKGKGVVDGTATVTFYGDNPSRYINGGGDHP